jgi:hypothetical protein
MTTNPKNDSETYELGSDPNSDPNSKRNPEDLKVPPENKRAIRERNLDRTIEDSFPTSDPPSTIPNPGEEEDAA